MSYSLPLGGLVRLVLQMEFKYRDRVGIVMDILETVADNPKGKTKTGIMRSANLNFDQANKYLELLILCDLLKAQDPLGNGEAFRYRLTDKGLRIARNLAELQFALQPLLQKPI